MTSEGFVVGFTALVVAKAPVPGLAKTRLAAAIGDDAAADIAAAALLDTLRAVMSARATTRIVALTGGLSDAARPAEISDALANFVVIDQRGDNLADRLVNAHADAAEISVAPIVQVGMDTPQMSPVLLKQAGRALRCADPTAILGHACDGGWWLLGVQQAEIATALADVPPSRPDTGVRTSAALKRTGVRVSQFPVLRDVDYVDDLRPVAAECPAGSRFRAAVHAFSSG